MGGKLGCVRMWRSEGSGMSGNAERRWGVWLECGWFAPAENFPQSLFLSHSSIPPVAQRQSQQTSNLQGDLYYSIPRIFYDAAIIPDTGKRDNFRPEKLGMAASAAWTKLLGRPGRRCAFGFSGSAWRIETHNAHRKLDLVTRVAPSELSINGIDSFCTAYQGDFETPVWYSVFETMGVTQYRKRPMHAVGPSRRRALGPDRLETSPTTDSSPSNDSVAET